MIAWPKYPLLLVFLCSLATAACTEANDDALFLEQTNDLKRQQRLRAWINEPCEEGFLLEGLKVEERKSFIESLGDALRRLGGWEGVDEDIEYFRLVGFESKFVRLENGQIAEHLPNGSVTEHDCERVQALLVLSAVNGLSEEEKKQGCLETENSYVYHEPFLPYKKRQHCFEFLARLAKRFLEVATFDKSFLSVKDDVPGLLEVRLNNVDRKTTDNHQYFHIHDGRQTIGDGRQTVVTYTHLLKGSPGASCEEAERIHKKSKEEGGNLLLDLYNYLKELLTTGPLKLMCGST